MPYDEGLAQRIREALEEVPDCVEKKMFGGIGFMVRGNMACGVHGDELIVRVGTDQAELALDNPNVRPFDLTGRPMKGWFWVASSGCEEDTELKAWVQQGVAFVLSLPAK